MRYVAFLRGINVGGHSIIKMADLKNCLSAIGLDEVQTYIQSGNVVFKSDSDSQQLLSKRISQAIYDTCKIQSDVAVFSAAEWLAVLQAAPDWWGQRSDWKHNILIIIGRDTPSQIQTVIGPLVEALEFLEVGNRVLYQSVSFEKFGRTAGGKIASKPLYKAMTVRNYNTAQRMGALLDDAS